MISWVAGERFGTMSSGVLSKKVRTSCKRLHQKEQPEPDAPLRLAAMRILAGSNRGVSSEFAFCDSWKTRKHECSSTCNFRSFRQRFEPSADKMRRRVSISPSRKTRRALLAKSKRRSAFVCRSSPFWVSRSSAKFKLWRSFSYAFWLDWYAWSEMTPETSLSVKVAVLASNRLICFWIWMRSLANVLSFSAYVRCNFSKTQSANSRGGWMDANNSSICRSNSDWRRYGWPHRMFLFLFVQRM